MEFYFYDISQKKHNLLVNSTYLQICSNCFRFWDLNQKLWNLLKLSVHEHYLQNELCHFSEKFFIDRPILLIIFTHISNCFICRDETLKSHTKFLHNWFNSHKLCIYHYSLWNNFMECIGVKENYTFKDHDKVKIFTRLKSILTLSFEPVTHLSKTVW